MYGSTLPTAEVRWAWGNNTTCHVHVIGWRGEHSGIGTVGVDTLIGDVEVQQDLHCLPVQDITAGETDDNKLHPKLQSFGQHSLSCEICCLFLPKALRTGKKMVPGKGHEEKMAPVHFFSHGSTMMLGEDSNSARYWEKMGDLALANGLEHVIMMVSGHVSLRPEDWSLVNTRTIWK